MGINLKLLKEIKKAIGDKNSELNIYVLWGSELKSAYEISKELDISLSKVMDIKYLKYPKISEYENLQLEEIENILKVGLGVDKLEKSLDELYEEFVKDCIEYYIDDIQTGFPSKSMDELQKADDDIMDWFSFLRRNENINLKEYVKKVTGFDSNISNEEYERTLAYYRLSQLRGLYYSGEVVKNTFGVKFLEEFFTKLWLYQDEDVIKYRDPDNNFKVYPKTKYFSTPLVWTVKEYGYSEEELLKGTGLSYKGIYEVLTQDSKASVKNAVKVYNNIIKQQGYKEKEVWFEEVTCNMYKMVVSKGVIDLSNYHKNQKFLTSGNLIQNDKEIQIYFLIDNDVEICENGDFKLEKEDNYIGYLKI